MGKYLGHAIVDGVLRFLSVSSMELFDDTNKEGCPRRWFARYKLGYKDQGDARTDDGIDYHDEAKRLLTGALAPDAVSPVLRQGLYLLPQPGPDLLVEQDISDTVKVGGVPLIGSLDLFNPRGGPYAPGRPADPPGTVELVDHKFRDRLANAPPVGDLLGGVQMPGYGRWILNRMPNVSWVRLSHITYSKKLEGAEKTPTTRVTPEQLLKRGAEMDAIALRMVDVAKEREANAVPANPLVCMKYGRLCPFAAHCSACPPGIRPKERKVEMTPEMLKAFDLVPDMVPVKAPRLVIQDETAKPIPAGRCVVGQMVLTPDKARRRFLQQEGANFVFVGEGLVPLHIGPDVLVEPIPETPESFTAGRESVLAQQSVPKDGHQGVVPSDAPKSQMIPGMAFAAEDGSLEADKKKRKGKKKESTPTASTAPEGWYYLAAAGTNVYKENGKMEARSEAGKTYPLHPTTTLETAKLEIGLKSPGPLPVVVTTPTAQPAAPSAIEVLKDAVSRAAASTADSEDSHAGCIKDAPEKLAAAVLEVAEKQVTSIPAVYVDPQHPAAAEAVNALLASAEALADAILARLKGRRIVITIE